MPFETFRSVTHPGARLKPLTVTFTVLSFLALVSIVPYVAARPSTLGKISIGVLWDLSGSLSNQGIASLIAARKAVNDVNRQGIAAGGKSIRLLVADTAGNPGKLLVETSEFTRLQQADILVGPTASSLVGTISGFASVHKIPLILTAGSRPVIPFRGRNISWIFTVSPGIIPEIKALYQALNLQRLSSIGILTVANRSGDQAALWLQGYAPEYHLKVVGHEGFGQGDTDAMLQMARLQEKGAQVIIVWGGRMAGRVLLRSLHGIDVPVVVPQDMLSNALLVNFPDPRSRLWTIASPVLLGTSLPHGHPCNFAVERFLEAMRMDGTSFSIDGLLAAGKAWDAIHLASMAISSTPYMTATGIRDALETMKNDYIGVMGIFHPSKRNHGGLLPRSLLIASLTPAGWRAVNDNIRKNLDKVNREQAMHPSVIPTKP